MVASRSLPRPARQARPRPGVRGLARHGALALALAAGAGAHAQSLLELYDTAHAYDAAYLSARALAESVPYRIEQSEALLRPSAALGSGASRVQTDPALGANYGSNTLSVSLTAASRSSTASMPRRCARPRSRWTCRAPISTAPSRT